MTVPRPYYDRDGITIYCGDCRDILPSLVADLIVTDPPYGTQDLGGGYGRRQNWSTDGRLGRTIAGDSDLSVLADAWPLIVATGAAWAEVFFAPRRTPQLCAIVGEHWIGEVVWDGLCPGLGYTVRYQHESIAVLRLSPSTKPLQPIISVHRYPAPSVADHPHAKPVGLMKRLIRWLPGEVVLDPFMGTGATLIAAKELYRRGIGIEIDERNCEIATERLAQGVLPLEASAT
jgi:DNA modification methylase